MVQVMMTGENSARDQQSAQRGYGHPAGIYGPVIRILLCINVVTVR